MLIQAVSICLHSIPKDYCLLYFDAGYRCWQPITQLDINLAISKRDYPIRFELDEDPTRLELPSKNSSLKETTNATL